MPYFRLKLYSKCGSICGAFVRVHHKNYANLVLSYIFSIYVPNNLTIPFRGNHFIDPMAVPITVAIMGKQVTRIQRKGLMQFKQIIANWIFFYILWDILHTHYSDVIMTAMASQITSLTIAYSIVLRADQDIKAPRHWPLRVEFTVGRWIPKGTVARKMFPFDDVISSWAQTL